MRSVLIRDKKPYILAKRYSLTEDVAMNNVKKFEQAVRALTPMLTSTFMHLSDEEKESVTEIRLRVRKPVIAVTVNGICFLHRSAKLTQVYSDAVVKTCEKEIEEVFSRLCGYSVYSHRDAINKGYITISGGHRAGVAGTAVTEHGRVVSVRNISCINLRIAKEITGAADDVYNRCFSQGLGGLIVAGPPSSGKTTVLRDLARQLSGTEKGLFAKVFVCDERGELGASHGSVAQNDIGINCDLITSYPKKDGILIGLRSFSPDIIICDEIATDEELDAVESGLRCGVHFALSIHAETEKDLRSKPAYRRLVSSGCFGNTVLLSGLQPGKAERFFTGSELLG